MESFYIYGMRVEDDKYFIQIMNSVKQMIEEYEIRVNSEGEKYFIARVGSKVINEVG